MDLVFATSNLHKVREAQTILGSPWRLKALAEIGWSDEINETASTLEGNALLKARAVSDKLEINCIAEDTGLEVDALDGAPGVYSARYAGPNASAEDNIRKLLEALRAEDNRGGQFRTVVTLVLDGAAFHFTGVVRGTIIDSPRGDKGFGYDPVFVPDGHDRTFAQMDAEEKAQISHRARAMQKMAAFLTAYLKRRSP